MKMSKFEKKFGKYAIPNLTMILIMCYVAGYLLEIMMPDIVMYLRLDPYAILRGQVWRLFTWLLIPPESLNVFTIVMLFFYYSIGTTLERTWGTYRYNVFLFSGMFFTILSSFLCLGLFCLLQKDASATPELLKLVSAGIGASFSTFYISTSIFLGFAMTYPEAQVLLMFIIPVKVKWIGMFELGFLLLALLTDGIPVRFAIGAALLNVLIFYLSSKGYMQISPKQIKRRSDFKREVKRSTSVTRHKCAVCGRTEEDAPELEFRFCSKCNGNYEYCQYHLFTHEHVK